MIPRRVSLSNFLTYATSSDGNPVTFDFDGARLWSINGDNGAGKTAVFDAVTYALFGEHRGGRQHDRRLVRKGTTNMEVAFEFSHAGYNWRIRRTLNLQKRRNGTTSEAKTAEVAAWHSSHGDWMPVPDADTPRGVDSWVTDTLKLTAAVFKSTVLLEQGGADRLLTVRPAERFDILAGLIDLDVYRRLELAAAARRRDAQATTKSIAAQLEAIPERSDEELAGAHKAVDEANEGLDTARTLSSQAAAALDGARKFIDLCDEASQLETRLEALDQLLAQSESIRADAARVTELNTIIPTLKDSVCLLDKAAASQEAAAQTEEELGTISLAELGDELQEAALAHEEADANVESLETTDEEFRTWQPHLEQRQTARANVARCRETLGASGAPAAIAAEINGLIERHDAGMATLANLEAKQESLRDDAASLRAEAEQLAGLIAEREDAKGDANCSRCGQPIDAAHLDEQLKELGIAASSATVKAAEATKRRDALKPEIMAARELEQDLTRQIDAGRIREKAATEAAEVLAVAIDALNAILADPLPEPWAAADGDDDSAKAAAAELHYRAQRLPAQLRAGRQDAKTCRERHDAARQQLHEAEVRVTRLEGDIGQHEEAARISHEAATARIADLDEELRAAFAQRRDSLIADLETEAQALDDAPGRLDALTNAETEHHTAHARATTIAREQDAIPPEHRLAIEDAEAALQRAETEVDRAASTRDDARDALRSLEEEMDRRKKLVDQHTEVARRGALAHRLERLLGRSGLQGALLKQAIDGVAELANETLSRLSQGTLTIYLQVDDTTESRKLEIHVTDATSADEPLEAAFISGSQKFRVAVALAAGLGQYVGGPDAFRSLIIDEGFGSLDETGRDEMIAELHNLANHLERVIVVSHHADFSDTTRFPQSFHLRKVGRHTDVTRVI